MPSVSGQINYNDLTVYINSPSVVLKGPSAIMAPPPIQALIERSLMGLQITLDTGDLTTVQFLDVLSDSYEEFGRHLSEKADLFLCSAGMLVWKGSASVDAQGEITFEGSLTRLKGEDYAAYADMLSRLDAMEREQMLEHAKQCPHCATRLGVQLAEGSVPPEVLAACNYGGQTGQA